MCVATLHINFSYLYYENYFCVQLAIVISHN